MGHGKQCPVPMTSLFGNKLTHKQAGILFGAVAIAGITLASYRSARINGLERLENEVKEMRLFEPSQEIAEELNARIEEAVDQVDELKAGMSLFEMAPDSADVSTVAASDIGPGHNRSSIGSNRVSLGTVKGSTMDVFGACQDD
mgnify:CR=1 FL=1